NARAGLWLCHHRRRLLARFLHQDLQCRADRGLDPGRLSRPHQAGRLTGVGRRFRKWSFRIPRFWHFRQGRIHPSLGPETACAASKRSMAMYTVGEEEIDALARIIRSGALFRYRDNGECERFEHRYAEHLGVKHFALTVSGTFALSAAITALGIG